MLHSLRLKSLKLRNFKGIAELDLTLDESLTLLAGVNGVGKTSVIQALVAAVTHTWWRITTHRYPFFRLPDDVARTGSSGTDIVLELAWGELLPVPARFVLRNGGLRLEKSHDSHLMKNFEALPASLPLVVYYEQNRVVTSRTKPGMVAVSSTTNRDSSLHTTVSSASEFKAWFFDKEADEDVRHGSARTCNMRIRHSRPSGACSPNWTGSRPSAPESRLRAANGYCYSRRKG